MNRATSVLRARQIMLSLYSHVTSTLCRVVAQTALRLCCIAGCAWRRHGIATMMLCLLPIIDPLDKIEVITSFLQAIHPSLFLANPQSPTISERRYGKELRH